MNFRQVYAQLLIIFCAVNFAWAAGNETVMPLPDANPSASSYSRTRVMLQQELPAILSRLAEPGWIVSGGLHGVEAGCTSDAFPVEGFTSSGNRITANAAGGSIAINYSNMGCNCGNPASDVAWVIASATTSNTIGNYVRVTGSNYFVNCTDTVRPATPADSVELMRVTITNGAIAEVFDRRKPSSYARWGVFDVLDPLYGGVADCTETGSGTDNVLPFRAAIAAAKEQGSFVSFDGWMCLSDQLTVTLDTFQEGFGIQGRSWNRASESFPVRGYDSRIWFTNTDPNKSALRFEQTVFSPGGSFTPVVLRDFGIQASTSARGLNRGIKSYGIPLHASNIGANYLLIGIDNEEANGSYLEDVSARKNAATNLRLVNCYECILIKPYLPESSTFYHGGSTPYTGIGLTISGAQFGMIQTPHVSGAPIGMTIDGTSDFEIKQPYFESNDNGAGTLTSATIGQTTNNINLRILNAHNQDPSALYNVDRMVGGRLEVGAAVLRTDNTVNVDIISKIHPSLNPFTDAGVPDMARARMTINPNMVPDGNFVLQPFLNKHHIIDGGGTGAGTLSFIDTPLGLAPGRKYLRINAAGGTKVYFYPTTMGQHSLTPGVQVYYHIWYYVGSGADDPQASLRIEYVGVDSGGTCCVTNYSSTVQLASTGWANARFRDAVPSAGGMAALSQVRFEFTLGDPGNLHLGSLSASVRPEPSEFNSRDGAMPFRVTATAAAPHVLTGITLADFNVQCTGETADAVSVVTAGGTIEIRTASVGAVGINCLATPNQVRGY